MSQGSHRRSAVRMITIAAGLALVASGCAASSSPASGGGSGNVLRIGTDVDLETADSVQVRITTDRQIMGSTVYEPLFTSGPTGKPTPALAKSATSSDNNLVWTLTLQSGVKFQDGKPFTASDVKANFDTILNPKSASDIAGDFSNIASVDVVSPTEAKFTLRNADDDFPASITDYPLMGDMTARAKMGVQAWDQHPIGTGPYEWASRTVGDNITFKRFAGYWRGRPPLSGVQFKIITDPTVATLALENGDIDMMTNDEIATQALPSLEKSPNFKVLSVPSNTLYHAWLNFGAPRVNQYKNVLAFHQGLAYLFNTQSVVNKVVGAFGTYTDQELPSWQPGYDPNLKAFPYDPQKGIQLLTQAGFPKGSTLHFVVINAPDLCQVATAIQSQIQQLGYKVTLLCSDASDTGVGPNYTWDVVFDRSSGRPDAATYFHDRWDKGLALPKDDKNTFVNAEMQSTIDQIAQQPAEAAATKLAQKASDIIIRDQTAVIPLFFANTYVVASKRVHGLVLSRLGWQSLLMNSYTTVTLGPST
jgi:peptide/nickel transport system substrate-binding protein